ncbi:TRAP transporter small permease subunit [Lentibacter sp. XHP0401]|jgi:TRAP-type C4-dicarboxylate transport system permease small subunit|uniref:TRAP transporter small permease subunit n=1 Tax=Lentibacter sp. XHP0401 TaxID=2984334 RepID=UPI0021E95F26|nr:TRAP transporter small permease [Lentibacter sp. XHP0401]MCV2894302.1 TRAP transporter small permease [Lentibacter sp. XHP0401]
MIQRISHTVAHLLVIIAALALLLMMFHVTADVIGKYVFNAPIPGTAEVVASYYMVAAVFLPLAWVEIKESSITVELLYSLFGHRAKNLALLLATAVSALFYGGLAWLLWAPALQSYRIGEIVEGTWRVVIWPTKFLLPLGLALACLVMVLRLFQIITGRYTPNLHTADPS